MKIKLVKLITFLLIGTGVITLSYPIVSSRLVARNQTTAIKGYGLSVEEMNERKREEEFKKAREYNELLSGIGIVDPFIPDSGYVLPKEYLSVLNINGVIGFIDIPQIDAHIPIYHGTDDETLKKGAGHLQNTAFPIGGEGNHSVLTGHSGLSSAKLFTDLEKLEIGDTFFITVLNEKLAYKIDQILTVEPSSTDELIPVKGKDYLTLITCTPYGVNSHRLFVRAQRIDYKPQGGEVLLLNNIISIVLFSLAIIINIVRFLKKRKQLKTYN